MHRPDPAFDKVENSCWLRQKWTLNFKSTMKKWFGGNRNVKIIKIKSFWGRKERNILSNRIFMRPHFMVVILYPCLQVSAGKLADTELKVFESLCLLLVQHMSWFLCWEILIVSSLFHHSPLLAVYKVIFQVSE